MDLDGYVRTLRARDLTLREQRRARARLVEGRLPEVTRVLCERFGARRVVLFGSLLGGELHEGSDLDLVVSGLDPKQYWHALDAASEAAGITVDLIRWEEAPRSLAERIASEGRVLHGE